MLLAGLVLAAVAAAVHVYVFHLESLAWGGPRARRIFGLRSDEQVAMTRELAYNQGFYNLFLVVEVVAGIVALAAGQRTVGVTLVLVGTGSMVAAALVLVLSSRGRARAAAAQGLVPALAIVLVLLGL